MRSYLSVLLLVCANASLCIAYGCMRPTFSAALDTRLSPKKNDVIVFPKVLLQQGIGYSRDTGVFTAPEGGYYVFVMTLKTICKGCSITVNLVRENEVVGRLSVGNSYRVDQTSITSLVRLNIGQEVKVKVADISGRLTLDHEMNTVFSGYLDLKKPMFSAALSNQLVPKLKESIVLSKVLLQSGSGYNKTTGVFTAPYDGVYTFVVTVRTKCQRCMIYLKLERDGVIVASLSVGNDKSWDQDSITSFVELRTGQKVQLKAYRIRSSKGVVTKLSDGFDTMFSGYLEFRTPIFSATIPSYVKVRANKNPVIVLPKVTLQKGNGYNKNNGIFTAPQDGIYVFVMTIRLRCAGDCSASVKLLRDDHIVASLAAGNNWKWDMTSVTSFVELLAGQEVKAKVVATTGAMKLAAYEYTYFSGYLL